MLPGEENSSAGPAVYWCEPRGTGATAWTTKNPPNYVERAHVLIGQTVDTGRIRDVVAIARLLEARGVQRLTLLGAESNGVIAAYAALALANVERVIAVAPPSSHESPGAPQILAVLRVCDIPEVLGLLAPRSLELRDAAGPLVERVQAIYGAAGAAPRLKVLSAVR